MRHFRFFALAITMIIAGCSQTVPNYNKILEKINNSILAGNLKTAISLADSLKSITANEKVLWKADSLMQISERIPVDFPLTEDDVRELLQKRFAEKYNPGDIKKWEAAGWLEYRLINGEKRYFSRAASNLMLLKNFHLERATADSTAAHDPELVFRKTHTERIISACGKLQAPAEPVAMEIIYTLIVKPDVVPDGEVIRCWLPYPKENNPRQKDIYLLGVSNENFILSPDSSVHRTIYMENKAEKGKPTIFRISYSYRSSGLYFDPSALKILPYNKNAGLYRKYTAEHLPQICFTSNIRHLADSITGNEENPFEIVRKIYYWFSNNIPWAGALEYSTIPNIPEYVLANLRGDCGMQTFLFMSMLRYKGVPVKWESGWNMQPDCKNLHDWSEVYFEGIGWVPVDISYGLQYSDNQKTKEFYISGIDSYRLIVNDGVAGTLYPTKKFLRSEPFDFQRGEVEWKGGNLYFDKWNYDMKIVYKNQ
jgi:Transglutaminase-like superfamily